MSNDRAQCGNCGNKWDLRVGIEDRQTAPRCPECRSRQVGIIRDHEPTPDAETDYAEAFEALESGSTALDLVRDLGLPPERAEAVERQHSRLSGRVVLTEDKLAERIDEEREEAREEGRREVRAERQEDQKRIRELRQENSRLSAEIEDLHDETDAEVWAAREDAEAETEKRLAAKFAAELAELQQDVQGSRDELEDEYEERIEELEAERKKAMAKLALFEGSDETKIWADGYESGTFDGARATAGEGKLEGFVLAAEHLGGNGASIEGRSPG